MSTFEGLTHNLFLRTRWSTLVPLKWNFWLIYIKKLHLSLHSRLFTPPWFCKLMINIIQVGSGRQNSSLSRAAKFESSPARHIYILARTPRCTVLLPVGTFFPTPTILPVSQRVFDWNRLLLPGSDQCINRCFGCYFCPNPHPALRRFHNTNIPTVPLTANPHPHPQAPEENPNTTKKK